MSKHKVRIPPIDLNDLSEEQGASLGSKDDPRRELNLFKVLVQHPDLFKSYAGLAMRLGTASILPPRDKEIMILRTLALCGETYETAHHDHIAAAAGFNEQEIESARKGGGEGLQPFDLILLAAVEELVKDHCVSDKTWTKLSERYSKEQLMETVFLIGCYTMGSMVNNSLGIQLENEIDKTWKPTQQE